jgi:hypothetical protein
VSCNACHPLCHQSQRSLRRQASHHLPLQLAVLSESSKPFLLSAASRRACLRRFHRSQVAIRVKCAVVHAILCTIKVKGEFDVAIRCAFDDKRAIDCLFNRLNYRSPASRSVRVQRAVELALVKVIIVKLLFESSEPWCMPSYVPSKSREPSTLPSAVPSTSSYPSSACSIGCTIRVQRAVELDFVHAIRGNYTVVHAIKVNRAFDVAICYSAFEVNGAIGCSISCASESEPSNLPSSTRSDSSLPPSRPSSVKSKQASDVPVCFAIKEKRALVCSISCTIQVQ